MVALGGADVLGAGCSVAVGIGNRVVVVIGTWGVGGVVLVVAVADVVWVCGATTIESRDELLTTTSANTRPVTNRAAAPAAIHSQRGDFGGGGGGGGCCG